MLRSLFIQNIILIEQAELIFHSGFHVLTGETGAGKSAILKALRLVAGERADIQALRQGAERGVVEASFAAPAHSAFREVLEQAQIDWTPELTIRREMTITGRNRAFVNDQMIPLTVLKQLGEHLMQICGQHANQELRDKEKHRTILDTFSGLQIEQQAFAEAWQHENRLRQELTALQKNEAQRLREIDEAQRQHEELTEARLKEGEEEELFTEYTLLSSAEELASGVNQAYEAISETGHLKSALQQLESLKKLDSTLNESVDTLRSTLVEMDELAYTLRSYLGRIEHNPQRAEEINRRLSALSKLNKKYGPNPIHYFQQLEERLDALQKADDRTEELQIALDAAAKRSNELALKLTEKRQKGGRKLEHELTQQLKTLNMPAVEFHVRLAPGTRCLLGDDQVEFLFAPNIGERLISISDCASGGELSRLMLALQAILAGKNCLPTLVFDEVDANIGGETATVVGQKLAEIGIDRQVLCVSHFPQVAKFAHHHYQVAKSTSHNRTITQVTALESKAREKELRRMVGE